MLKETTIKDVKQYLQQCQFRELCDKYFHPKFNWVIRGTSQLSGRYHNLEDFFAQVIGRLNARLQSGWKMHIIDAYVSNNTLIVEMKGEIKTIIDTDYNNEYCWIFKFDDDNKVIELIAYYDSLLVDKTLAIELL